MFDSLSSKLQNAFRNLRGLGKISEDNVGDALRRSASRTPKQRAVQFLGRELTYAELDALREQFTKEALAAGVFGAPSFVLPSGEIFWGQDRLELLERTLKKLA